MATRTDLIHRTLRNLGALPQGQSPADEDYQSISDLVDWTAAELEKRDIIYIPNLEAIDDHVIQPFAHILAWRAAPEFGAASDASLAALAAQAEIFLRNMESIRPTYEILSADYF